MTNTNTQNTIKTFTDLKAAGAVKLAYADHSVWDEPSACLYGVKNENNVFSSDSDYELFVVVGGISREVFPVCFGWGFRDSFGAHGVEVAVVGSDKYFKFHAVSFEYEVPFNQVFKMINDYPADFDPNSDDFQGAGFFGWPLDMLETGEACGDYLAWFEALK